MLFPGIVWAVLLATPATEARDRLLVFNSAEESVSLSLIEALKIQLFDLVQIQPVDGLAPNPLSERTREATDRITAEGARFGLWVETTTLSASQSQQMLVLVDAKGEGLISALPMGARQEPELDRALALKVREVIESSAPKPEAPSEVIQAEPPPELPPKNAQKTRLFFDLGGAAMVAPHPAQVALTLGAGASFDVGAIRLEPRLGAALMSDFDVEVDGARVSVAEWQLVGGMRAMYAAAGFDVGAAFDLGGRRLSATGVSSLGTSGETSRWVPWLGLAFEGRVRMTERAHVRLGLGGELMVKSQTFAINQVEVLDVGGWRLRADLGLVFHVF